MAGERVKLTKPQTELLRYIGRWPTRVVANYKPAQRLIEIGYATGENLEKPYALLVTTTDLGRRALADTADGGEGRRDG